MYNELAKLVETDAPLGNQFTFVYNERYLLQKQVDGNHQANQAGTQFVYDARHLRISETTTGQKMWRYTYDGKGNVATQSDPGGHLTTFLRGQRERVMQESYAADPDAATPPPAAALPSLQGTVKLYNGNGQLLAVQETKTTDQGPAVELTQRTYDARARLHAETRYDGKVVTYGYDDQGNREPR